MGAMFAEKVKGLRAALMQTRVDPTEAQANLRLLVDEDSPYAAGRGAGD